MRRWVITGISIMKKLFVVLFAVMTSISLLGSSGNDNIRVNLANNEAGSDYIYLTDVTGWTSATESDKYSIYYKEGNGERVYYFYNGYYYGDIHDNDYYNSPVCNDFRKKFQYVSGECYFNCNLPGRKREVIDGYHFYTQVLGWDNTTDSDIYSIYFKEGNGERVYYFYNGYYYGDIHDNDYYNSPVCNDFRKKYQYVSGERFFNCTLSGREREVIDGYHFYTQVIAWNSTIDSEIYSLYYKEGNGKKIYYLYNGYYYGKVHKNEYYNNPTCNDYRKNYKYVSDEKYFNLPSRK